MRVTTFFLTMTTLFTLACDGEKGESDSGSTDAGDSGAPDGEDSGASDVDADSDADGDGDADVDDTGEPPAPPVELVSVTINGSVLLATNYGNQLYTVISSTFSAGSAMGRMQLFARWCTDAACNDPVGLTPLEVDGADSDGYYVYSSASTSGSGFAKEFVVTEAPVGTWYMQVVGDTQFSREAGKGSCSDTTDCPGDSDVLQVATYDVIGGNISGENPEGNPVPATIELTIAAEGAEIDLNDILPGVDPACTGEEGEDCHVFMGHIYFDGENLWSPHAPADAGRLLVAASNEADDARNYMALIDLDDVSGSSGVDSDSYTLMKDGSEFFGDVCTVIRGTDAMYAVGIDGDGANIFQLNNDGTQASETPIAILPPTNPDDGSTWPRPCRGVFAERDGSQHLYMVYFKGAGSEDTSYPAPMYHVNLTTGAYEFLFEDYVTYAFRGIAVNADASKLFVVDQSWSKNSKDYDVLFHRISALDIGSDGSVGSLDLVTTDIYGDNGCGSSLSSPSATTMLNIGGTEQLVVGNDYGVSVFDPSDLTKLYDVDLETFGILFGQLSTSPDGTRAYAMPQCKADNSNHNWTLPYGAPGSVENADKNLIAILDTTGSTLVVADTSIDVNEDGDLDHGVDMDYFNIKDYIRTFNSTLAIPPVVFMGPQMAAGESMLFVRGSGIQGNGGDTISASGLGQACDVGVLNLENGKGVVLNEYLPWFNGMSAVDGTARWGYTIHESHISSIGWIEYIPAE